MRQQLRPRILGARPALDEHLAAMQSVDPHMDTDHLVCLAYSASLETGDIAASGPYAMQDLLHHLTDSAELQTSLDRHVDPM